MARLPRISIPGCPHHLIQRGNNRQPTFLEASDYEYLLALLAEYAPRCKVGIHSYVLMSNHFHLLATPETPTGLTLMMQAVGRRYVQAFNKRHRRSGTLWEGRYKSTLIQTERYLLACMVYIDLNPVRASLAPRAADYRWSSHAHYIGLRRDKLIAPHAQWWQLGNTPFEREASYAALVAQGITSQQQSALTESVLKGWALGDPEFVVNLQAQTDRRLTRGHAGRPASSKLS